MTVHSVFVILCILCLSQTNIIFFPTGLRKQYKHRGTRTVSPGIIDRALNVCQEFLDSLDHSDIDVIMETPP